MRTCTESSGIWCSTSMPEKVLFYSDPDYNSSYFTEEGMGSNKVNLYSNKPWSAPTQHSNWSENIRSRNIVN